MGGRAEAFAPEEVYHVYTRGVDQRTIFEDEHDRERLRTLLRYCLPAGHIPSFSTLRRMNKKLQQRATSAPLERGVQRLVDVLCYCFMPNHLHLLLREQIKGGISKYMQRVLNSYARYFNERHRRTGTLFSSRFQFVHVGTDAQLLHVSRYIHLNPYVANMIRDPLSYRWSSLAEYIDRSRAADPFCSTDLILSMMRPDQYKRFVTDHAGYARSLRRMPNLYLEDVAVVG